MTGRKKHLRVLKDLRIQHEAYISTDPNAKMYEKEDKDIADALDYVISVLEQEPILDKISAEIAEYGSIWVEYKITGRRDKDIEQLVTDVLKQAKKQVLEVIDKYRGESEEE